MARVNAANLTPVAYDAALAHKEAALARLKQPQPQQQQQKMLPIPSPAVLLPRIAHYLCEPFGFDEVSFSGNVSSIVQTMQLDTVDLLLALSFFLRYSSRIGGSLALSQSSELLYLFLVLLEVALKVTSDSPYSCKQLAKFFRLSGDRLMANETQLLATLDWRTFVKPEEVENLSKASGLPSEDLFLIMSSLIFPRPEVPAAAIAAAALCQPISPPSSPVASVAVGTPTCADCPLSTSANSSVPLASSASSTSAVSSSASAAVADVSVLNTPPPCYSTAPPPCTGLPEDPNEAASALPNSTSNAAHVAPRGMTESGVPVAGCASAPSLHHAAAFDASSVAAVARCVAVVTAAPEGAMGALPVPKDPRAAGVSGTGAPATMLRVLSQTAASKKTAGF